MTPSFFKSDIRPSALERSDRRAALKAHDEAESKKVKVRSGGQCEVRVTNAVRNRLGYIFAFRCQRRAVHIHHLLSGRGVRARGESADRIRKIHVCPDCHSAIHAHTLRRVGDVVPLWSDPYERVR